MWHEIQPSPFLSQHKDHDQLTFTAEATDLDEFAMAGFSSINSNTRSTLDSSETAYRPASQDPDSSPDIDRATSIARLVYKDNTNHQDFEYDMNPPRRSSDLAPFEASRLSAFIDDRHRLTSMDASEIPVDAEDTAEQQDLLDQFVDEFVNLGDHIEESVEGDEMGEPLQPHRVVKATTFSKRKPLGDIDSNLPTSTQKNRKKVKSEKSPIKAQYTTRSLRDRTEKQENPYQYDKTQHNLRQKNPQATDADVRREMYKAVVKKQEKKQKINTPAPNKKRKRSTSTSSLSELDSDQFDGSTMRSRQSLPRSTADSIRSHAQPDLEVRDIVVRTRFKQIMPGYQPLALTRNKTNSATIFIATILKKWEKRLGSSNVDYFTVSFPWLAEDDNILLEIDGDNQESYDEMVRRYTESPPNKDKSDATNHIYVDGILKNKTDHET